VTSEDQTPRAPAAEIGLLEQDLRREVGRGRVVVVVGAGVSVAATRGEAIASWVGLLENGVSRCEQVFLTLPDDWGDGLRARIRSGEADDLLFVAEEVTRVLGGPQSGEYRRWLRETVGRLEPRDPASIEALHDLGVPIVTTNYDSLIERVTGLEPVTWRGGPRIERLLRGDEPGVLHLHGHWEDPESVVLGIHSYEEVLGDAYAQFVPRALSAFNSLLFVGCGEGLKDPNFGALRRWLGEVFAGSEYRHFRLVLGSEARAVAAEHEPRERIFVVPYGDRHEDLAPFLRGLRPQLRPPTKGSARGLQRFQWSKRRLVVAVAVAALAVLGAVLGIVLTGGEEKGGGVGENATITLGETVEELGIEPSGQDEYTFTADEGQRIFPINGGNPVKRTCEGLDDLAWSLQRKDRAGFLFDASMNDCSYPAGPEGYDLSEGTYVLTIRNDGGAPAGYKFTLVDADPNQFEIKIGDPPVTRDIEPGVVNVHTFTVDAEQKIYLDNQELDNTCEGAYPLGWSLRRIGGAFVFEDKGMLNCEDPCRPEGCTVTKGTYALSVYGGDQPGRYRFTLRRTGSR